MNAIWQEPKAEAPKVAIVGMAAMFPGETGTTGFWRTIARGEDAIGDVPPHYWRIDDYYDPDPAAPDRTYCKRGGFLGTVAFDTLRFGVPPSAMQATDTAQLLALMTAAEVLDGVGQSQATPVDRSRTSVVLGVASATELCVHMGSRLQRPVWANALREAGLAEDQVTALCDRISDHFVPWQEATFPGLLGNVVAGRIANRLDLGGANFVTDAACASSMSALNDSVFCQTNFAMRASGTTGPENSRNFSGAIKPLLSQNASSNPTVAVLCPGKSCRSRSWIPACSGVRRARSMSSL